MKPLPEMSKQKGHGEDRNASRDSWPTSSRPPSLPDPPVQRVLAPQKPQKAGFGAKRGLEAKNEIGPFQAVFASATTRDDPRSPKTGFSARNSENGHWKRFAGWGGCKRKKGGAGGNKTLNHRTDTFSESWPIDVRAHARKIAARAFA